MDNPTKSDAITTDTSVSEVKKIILQLEAIVEESHDAIIGKTLDGIVVTWNGGATRLFGYTRDEMIGKSIAELFAPENKDELPGLLERIRKGETITDYDSIWIKKDGTKADVEFSLSPIHAEKGLVIGTSLVGRDITEKRKITETLRQTQEVVDSANDAIIRATLDGTIVGWNQGAEKMLGYRKEDIVGKSASILVPPEMGNQIKMILDKVKEGKIIEDFDTIRIHKNGSRVDTAASVAPIRNKDGLVVAVSVVERNIVKRKIVEFELRKKYEEIDKFYHLTVGRELEMIELKEKIKELEAKVADKV